MNEIIDIYCTLKKNVFLDYRFARAIRRSRNTDEVFLGSEVGNMKLTNIKMRDNELNDHIDIVQDSDVIQLLEPRFSEVAVQVDFYEEEVNSTYINMFSTIRENGVTCEAGTQADISFKKSEKKL